MRQLAIRFEICLIVVILGIFPFCRFCHGQPLRIMPFGDSHTVGYHGSEAQRGSYRRYLEDQLHNLGFEFDFVGSLASGYDGLQDIDHQGTNSFTIENLVEQFGPAIANHRPDVMLVLAGTNDHWKTPIREEFVTRFDSLVRLGVDNSPGTKHYFRHRSADGMLS